MARAGKLEEGLESKVVRLSDEGERGRERAEDDDQGEREGEETLSFVVVVVSPGAEGAGLDGQSW